MFCFVFSQNYFTLYFTFLDLFSQLHFMEKIGALLFLQTFLHWVSTLNYTLIQRAKVLACKEGTLRRGDRQVNNQLHAAWEGLY